MRGEDAHPRCARARRLRDEGEVATTSTSATQEEMRGDAAGGRGRRVPVCGCVEGLSHVLDGIGLSQNPIPTLPNTIFGLAREIAPARARFRVTEDFGPFPPKNSLTKTSP
jgi:hypothetical protein